MSSVSSHSQSDPASAHGDPLTPEIQIHTLRSGDSGERYYAAWWLGRMRIQAGVKPLIEALTYDQDRTIQGGYPVRRNAAQALGKLRDPEAIPPLLEILECGDAHLLGIVAQALGQIAEDHPEWVPQVSERLVTWLQGQDPQAAPAIALEGVIETLGSLQVRSAIPDLRPYLHHDSIRVHCSAARALYLLTSDPAHIQRLLAVLDHQVLTLRRGAVMDLGATGYLPGATAIAGAAVEANIKLLALKSMLDRHLAIDPRPTSEVCGVLTVIDGLL